MEKRCRKCGEEKPLEEFYLNRATKDGRTTRCADCMRAYSKQRNATPEGKEYNRKYFQGKVASGRNAEYQREYRRTEKGKRVHALYWSSEKGWATQERYRRSGKAKETRAQAYRRRMSDPDYRDEKRGKWRKLNKTAASKAAQKRYWKSEKGVRVKQEKDKAYKKTDKGKAAIRRYSASRRANLEKCENTLTAAEWREILEKHDHRCTYCGKQLERLTMDHVIPLSRGGHHVRENVVPACRSCNSRKGAK